MPARSLFLNRYRHVGVGCGGGRALVATVPEGAGRLVFMLSAKYQEPASLAWFDDAALYLLPPD